ncbi:DELLA protein RGL3-like [Arachis stenosperma]|uniref:DELLA protein RGL3-like n=1 Tax=Arachis stenosperma TaxID=217475 RepID=UPI0025AC4C50|nr:DELLA protein RGL3-like [Arachis stenosperma]
MENLSPFNEFGFSAIEDKHSSSNYTSWAIEGMNEVNKVQFSGAEEWGESMGIDPFGSSFEFFPSQQQQQQQLSYLEYGTLENLQFVAVSPPPQTHTYFDDLHMFDENPTRMVPLSEETIANDKQQNSSTPLASLELLKSYGSNKGFKKLCDEEKIMQPIDHSAAGNEVLRRKLSTDDVMRIAGTRFIQSSPSSPKSLGSSALKSIFSHPFGQFFSGLSGEEKEEVQLAESLLACAEKVGFKQYGRAGKLLSQCESSSSKTGSPVKRVVHYFAEALRLRIDLETGRISSKDLKKMQPMDPREITKNLTPSVLAFYGAAPFCQITMFTLVQSIIENVTEAKKIHIIDFEIRKGVQWTTLMQSLVSRNRCPLELLMITAVGSGSNSKLIIEDTGKRLKDFAISLKINLCYDYVIVPDMLQLREDLFKIDPEETIVVYSQYALGSKIQQPDQLETIMRVVKTIRPSVLAITEIEASHNSTSFVNRFIEALFYFSAFFDCLENCMKHDEPNRLVFESQYLAYGIKNILAAEGAERNARNVRIDVWRAFFSRFGLVETEISMLSLFQAELVAKRFPCGSSCTFDRDGNSLLLGWKGTPLNSISVWKFL